MDPIRRLAEWALRFDLRRSLRRVSWVGEWPPSVPDGPVIAYSNHHSFYDGHLAWLLFSNQLERSPTIWMEEWHRLPFFAAVGAQPFPPDEPQRRAATIRRTARRFQANPKTVLVYYPEGTLRSPDQGLAPFASSSLERLATLYSDAQWWPYAVRVTLQADAKPTARIAGGTPHAADGRERRRLMQLLDTVQGTDASTDKVLLEGTQGPADRWDLSRLSSFFERYL